MEFLRNPKLRAALAAVLAALAACGVTIIATDDGGGHRTVTVHVGPSPAQTAAAQAAPAGDLAAPAPAGKSATIKPAESELRDETPPEISTDLLRAGLTKTIKLGDDAGVTDTPQPVGGAQNYSVRQDFSGHVYSDFGSVTPTEFCLHYTVSPNVTGWGDVTGVQGYFKRTMAASATFIGDFESHFLQMTPLSKKAWTQGAFNPYCRASIELIATGRETRAQWLASSLFRKHTLASLMVDVMRRYNLPVRFVDPVGCAAPAGYTDHNHIECGNNHTDVSPSFPFDVLRSQLAAAQRPACGKRCHRVRELRGKHARTHARFRKNGCSKKHGARAGYCNRLRSRNAAVHKAAKREHVGLKGTYK